MRAGLRWAAGVVPASGVGGWKRREGRSKHVQHSVAEFFRGFLSIAEIQELILQRAAVHVVHGPAHVADDFDVTTRSSSRHAQFVRTDIRIEGEVIALWG